MSEHVLLDNTVLCNFAAVGRLDLIVDMEQEHRNPRHPASVQELMNSYPY